MKLRHLLPLPAFVALGALPGAGLLPEPREVPSPFVGKPAPAFALPRLHEPGRTLGPADLRGRVWLLNVWASWCVSCREEHPLLVGVARQAEVPVYGLNYKDDPRNAQEWLLRLGDPYAASVVDRDGRTAIDYGVHGVPQTFVIDKQGVVRLKHVGPLTHELWLRDILPLVRTLL